MPDPLSELQRLGQEFDADGVTQADRDAAAETSKAIYYANSHSFACEADVEEMEGMLAQAFARHRIAAIEAARPMIEKEAWRPIESAPKDETTPVLVWFDHEADPHQDPLRPGRLTDYACHAEGGDFLSGQGVAIAVWREGWHENDGWESANPSYWMPAAWWDWHNGDAGDCVVNPTHWMPLPAPPAIRALGDRVG